MPSFSDWVEDSVAMIFVVAQGRRPYLGLSLGIPLLDNYSLM
jgi:hypothetical protein